VQVGVVVELALLLSVELLQELAQLAALNARRRRFPKTVFHYSMSL
jgi:hypothetical protein